MEIQAGSSDQKRCSQWSSTSLDTRKNLFSTLSQNLQRYERIFKHSHQNYRPPRVNYSVNSRRIVLPALPPTDNKENSNSQFNYLDVNLKASLKSSRKDVLKNRVCPRSSQEEGEGVVVKQREVKFSRRDKKKYKDRFMDVYVGMRQRKGQQKISLRQIDSINKQTKDEKIELFLKLLKR